MLTCYSTLRNQIESPLLCLPPETRNEIFKITVLSTYGGLIDGYRAPSREHILSWTRVCKQLHAETRLLPFALCAFKFRSDNDRAEFFDRTSLEQQKTVATLHLELLSDPADDNARKIRPKLVWPINHWMAAAFIAPTIKQFRSTFPNLQKVVVDVIYLEEDDKDFVESWVANVKEPNSDLQLQVKTDLKERRDYWIY